MSVSIDQQGKFSDREPLLRALAFEELVERVQTDYVLAARLEAFDDSFVRERRENEADSHTVIIAGEHMRFSEVVFTGVASNGTMLQLCELVEKDPSGRDYVNRYHKMVFLYREDDTFVMYPLVYDGSPVELERECWADFRTAENQQPWLEAMEFPPVKHKVTSDEDRDRVYVRSDANGTIEDAYIQVGLKRERVPLFALGDVKSAAERPLAEVIDIDTHRAQKLGELASA